MSLYKAVSDLPNVKVQTFLKLHGVNCDTDNSEDGKSELDEEYHTNKPPPISKDRLFANLVDSNGFDINKKRRRHRKRKQYKNETKTSVENEFTKVRIDGSSLGLSSNDKRRNKDRGHNISNIRNIKNDRVAKELQTEFNYGMNTLAKGFSTIGSYESLQQEEYDEYYAVEETEGEITYYHLDDILTYVSPPVKSSRSSKKRGYEKSNTRNKKNNWFAEEQQSNFGVDNTNLEMDLNYGIHKAANTFQTIDSYEMLQQEEYDYYPMDLYSKNSWGSSRERRHKNSKNSWFVQERQRNFGIGNTNLQMDFNYGMHAVANTFETIDSDDMSEQEEYDYYPMDLYANNSWRNSQKEEYLKYNNVGIDNDDSCLSMLLKVLLISISCACIYMWIKADRLKTWNSYLSMF